MSEEQKSADADKPTETPAEEKKDAEGQAIHRFFCRDCGTVFFHWRCWSGERCPNCGKCNTVRNDL